MKKLWIIFGVEIMIAGLLIIGYGIWYMNHRLNQINIDDLDKEDLNINDEVAELIDDHYIQIALFGIDARDVTTDVGNRSDTIMIATIDTDTYEVKISSVYRDTYLEVANPLNGKGEGLCTKVTHAYAYGGPDAAVATLNKNLDLRITDYVTVNFASMANAIDDLGGVTVNMSDIEQYETNIYLPETAEIAGRSYTPVYGTGDITVDGLQAVTYCRIRELSGGDIARAERQRETIEAILDKCKSSDLKTLNNVLDDVLPQIKTSLSKKEMLALMSHVNKYQVTRSEGFPLTYRLGNYYDETLDQNLSMDIPANLEWNVALLHQSIYGENISTITYDYQNHVPEGALNTSTPPASTESTLDGRIYTPSQTVIRISDHIENGTGVGPVDDPNFRGDVREIGY